MHRKTAENRSLRNLRTRQIVRGSSLAQFLNEPPASSEHSRVLEVFRLCLHLLPRNPISAAARGLHHVINDRVSDLPVVPFLDQRGWMWCPKTANPGDATFVLGVIALMFNDRSLERMRQC